MCFKALLTLLAPIKPTKTITEKKNLHTVLQESFPSDRKSYVKTVRTAALKGLSWRQHSEGKAEIKGNSTL